MREEEDLLCIILDSNEIFSEEGSCKSPSDDSFAAKADRWWCAGLSEDGTHPE